MTIFGVLASTNLTILPVCRFHSGLIMHMRVHTREKVASCNICNKQFSQHGSFKTHMIKVHKMAYDPAKYAEKSGENEENLGENEETCRENKEKCGENKDTSGENKDTSREKAQKSEDTKSKVCNVCGKFFT